LKKTFLIPQRHIRGKGAREVTIESESQKCKNWGGQGMKTVQAMSRGTKTPSRARAVPANDINRRGCGFQSAEGNWLRHRLGITVREWQSRTSKSHGIMEKFNKTIRDHQTGIWEKLWWRPLVLGEVGVEIAISNVMGSLSRKGRPCRCKTVERRNSNTVPSQQQVVRKREAERRATSGIVTGCERPIPRGNKRE